jgi:peptide-methionine (S)-S-oxide reductase
MTTEKAILAGGCFWGVEDLIRQLPGVISTTVGYTGGDVPNATYRNHGTHAEGIEIVFDPEKISYRKLLEFFFQIHDPTTRNRQGNDMGTSYRSAIFYVDEQQKETAQQLIAGLNEAKIYKAPVVTEVVPAGPFWVAEEYHQDYLQKYPNGYTCHWVRPDWKLTAQPQCWVAGKNQEADLWKSGGWASVWEKMAHLKKLAVCLLVGIVAAATLQRIIFRIIWEFGNRRIPPPVYVIIGLALVVLAVVICSRRIMAASEGILSGFIALDMVMFGWQKLLHQQGFIPLGRLDEPFSSFSGEDLTWAFFGRSFGFFCVIGIIQIAGGFLLLFRRTRLFGAIFLLPVLLNIVLLNIFYGFEAGDLVHTLILLIGLSYLILRHYGALVVLFFRREGVSQGNVVLPAVVMIAPLLLVMSFGSPDRNPQLTGKYRVVDLSVNQVRLIARSCEDSVLTTVYFDLNNEMVLKFNSLERIWIGSYRLDRATGALVASWRYPASAKDTLVGRLDRSITGEWQITGSLGKDRLSARLVRE